MTHQIYQRSWEDDAQKLQSIGTDGDCQPWTQMYHSAKVPIPEYKYDVCNLGSGRRSDNVCLSILRPCDD